MREGQAHELRRCAACVLHGYAADSPRGLDLGRIFVLGVIGPFATRLASLWNGGANRLPERP